jgi:hypothetical protein
MCVVVNYLFIREDTNGEDVFRVEAYLHALTSAPDEVIWASFTPGHFSSWEKTLITLAWETGWAESLPGSGGELKNSSPRREFIFDRSAHQVIIPSYPDHIKDSYGMQN